MMIDDGSEDRCVLYKKKIGFLDFEKCDENLSLSLSLTHSKTHSLML